MQENILFFKLYLLAHKSLYIDYMRGAKILARLFNFQSVVLLPTIPASILCGACYSILGKTRGGAITFTCSNCQGSSNLGYELMRLCEITKLDYHICTYCLIKAVEDIYKCNNVAVFKHVFVR